MSEPQLWRLGGKTLRLDQPRLMQIVNCDPESFYPGSRVDAAGGRLPEQLAALLAQEPDLLDIGGQSTRPGSVPVGAAEELARVLPVLRAARALAPELPITVDTYRAGVAEAALDSGADGVNDISAGRFDPLLLPLVARRGCGYVLMHMLGTPETMQAEPAYSDCAAEVRAFLADGLSRLAELGLAREAVALDPGIGFGKRLEDNLALLRDASALQAQLGRPLLYGLSRKSFIGRLSGAADPDARLPGTLAATLALCSRGVLLHRVHDTAALRQALAVWGAVGGGIP